MPSWHREGKSYLIICCMCLSCLKFHILDISVGVYHWVLTTLLVKTWMCMNFKYLNLSQHISGVFSHILHIQCHIIANCKGIIVLHSAYISLWIFWLLDKGPSRAKTCLVCMGGVTAHLHENCVVLFIVVVCSCYTVSHWCCIHDNDREWTQSLCYVL
jgi:hypothetical protein